MRRYHGPPRDAYVHGAFYNRDHSSSSSSDEDGHGRRRGRHHGSESEEHHDSDSEDHHEAEDDHHGPTFQGDRFQVTMDYDNVYEYVSCWVIRAVSPGLEL